MNLCSTKKIQNGLISSFEWIDFALYGYFGSIFSLIFFPDEKNQFALLATYAIFAIGFAARPLGAIIFGYLGDKYGRLVSLRITPFLITMTTLGMAFLPTYKFAGDYALVLLILIRLIQGVVLGGEFAGNIVYLCETSQKNKYLWGSIGSCTGSFGILLASLLASLVFARFTPGFINDYGWRIAYLMTVPLGFLSFYVRLKTPESPEFLFVNLQHNPIKHTLKSYKKLTIVCLGLILLHSTTFYFVFMFLPVYLTKFRDLSNEAALVNNTLFLLLHIVLIPIFAVLIDRFWQGIRACLVISIIFMLLSIPFCLLLSKTSSPIIIAILLMLSVMTSVNAAIIPALLNSIIPAHVRYTILAFSFNVGFGIFGGIVPFLGLYLIKIDSTMFTVGLYLTAVALITTIASLIQNRSASTNEIR